MITADDLTYAITVAIDSGNTTFLGEKLEYWILFNPEPTFQDWNIAYGLTNGPDEDPTEVGKVFLFDHIDGLSDLFYGGSNIVSKFAEEICDKMNENLL